MKTTTTLGNARPLMLALCLWLLCGGSTRSQEFTVSSFRLLPNDVSAFVNSVRLGEGRSAVRLCLLHALRHREA